MAERIVTANDPKMNGKAPYKGFSPVGFQSVLVKNSIGLTPFLMNDCNPFVVKKMVMEIVAAIMMTALSVTKKFPFEFPVHPRSIIL